MAINYDILKTIGLSSAEAKTYISLIELKESRTGELCKKTKIASSNIYVVLDSLMQKGFISYRLQNNIKIFMPSDPEVIKDLFNKKQRELEGQKTALTKIIESLKHKQSLESPISKYKYYEGLPGLRSIWLEMIEAMPTFPKGTKVRIYSAKKSSYKAMIPIYDLFNKKRKKLKIPYDLILNFDNKDRGEKRKKQGAKVRYANLQNEADVVIIGDVVVTEAFTGDIPRAFKIEDPVYAQLFRQMFDQIWQTAKK